MRRPFEGKSAKADPPKVREEIAKLAYTYFIKRGCQHGKALDDWLKAEKIIKGR